MPKLKHIVVAAILALPFLNIQGDASIDKTPTSFHAEAHVSVNVRGPEQEKPRRSGAANSNRRSHRVSVSRQ